MGLRRFLVMTGAAVAVLLTVLAWYYPAGDDFRTDNPFWNGFRLTSREVTLTPLPSLSRLPSLPAGSALVVIPYLAFTTAELDELNRFVTRGGTLVVADDYGHGNQVVARLGVSARFSGQILLDPLLSYKSAWFPRIYQLSSSALLANSDNLVFNHATALTNVAPGDVLARSSSASFLDRNASMRWDNNEVTGPLPVISQHSLGSGWLILISDPSIFINSMRGIGDNDSIIRNLALGAGGRVYIDQSHLPKSNLHDTKNTLISIRDYFATPLGTLGLVAVVLLVSLVPVWYRTRKP